MSALAPRADMCGATSTVRFGPQADISQRNRRRVPPPSWSLADAAALFGKQFFVGSQNQRLDRQL
jgi:hypothetical protein